ncbi:MAG: hypothetical protein V1769_02135 [Thermoplasmatota archaeon]|jgi:hypothetical protein
MIAESYKQIGRKTWYRWSFYINIVLFFIIAVSLYLLILDSYHAGKIANGGGDMLSQQWLYVARDLAFLSISLALVFFQFYRNLLTIIKRSL